MSALDRHLLAGHEVVQRVSGSDLQTFLLNRLPDVVRGVRFLDPSQQHTMAKSYWLASSGPVLAGVDIAQDFEHVNQNVVTVTATVPGAGRVPMRLGLGFNLGALWPHAYGWWNTGPCFGHAGGFGVVAYADPRTDVAVAIVTNRHRGMSDLARRFAPLGSAIRAALA